ncbi:MAG TPA: hypothetical protein EYO24_07255 [Candidatus Marinimicrobia bacterium]|nr:hypothetical protein [Candidatus Neomarinimicrobiota bacterium]
MKMFVGIKNKLQDPNPNPHSDLDLEFIKRIAKRIHKSGLITPAVLFLEMTKPLALIGSHAMIFFGPIITAFINAEGYYRAAEIFEDPNNVEKLVTEIELLENEATNNTNDIASQKTRVSSVQMEQK